jgi:hypothetical protein
MIKLKELSEAERIAIETHQKMNGIKTRAGALRNMIKLVSYADAIIKEQQKKGGD